MYVCLVMVCDFLLQSAAAAAERAAELAAAQARMEKAEQRLQMKAQKKDQEAARKMAIAREEAMADDEFAFDVSYEGQGKTTDDDGVDVAAGRDIRVDKLTVRAKGKVLLDNANLVIANKRRYGLVGPNGKGKTTLMKLLARRELPVPEYVDVLLVEQEVQGDEKSALQAVVDADVELTSLRAEEAELEEKLQRLGVSIDDEGSKVAEGASKLDAETEQVVEKSSERLGEVHERLTELGSDEAEGRAAKILSGLGFTTQMQTRTTMSFSGGWRMRISLARALFIEPTCLLLDEPTNHLDLRAVLWLEEYLIRWKKTLIVVSHDRDFLNSVSTDIVHLHDLKLHQYKGDYEMFRDMYEMKRSSANKDYEKFQKEMKRAKASGSKANQDKVKNREKHNSKKKQNAQDAADDDAVAVQPQKWSDYTVRFEFPEPTELAPPLIQVIDVEFTYPNRRDFKLERVNVGIDMGTRVAIVGPNGAGKSTLLNLIGGDIEPTEGEVRRNQKLRIGRYSQHFVDVLAMDVSAVGYLVERFSSQGLKNEHARAKLGKFGLPGANHLQPIVKLSGGQKARVVFAAISLSNPHILIFDEPTNHLDMESVDALAEALSTFEGGVVLVSHDARLISQVCDDERSQVWIVDKGTVTEYPGDFEEYKDELIKEIVQEQNEG